MSKFKGLLEAAREGEKKKPRSAKLLGTTTGATVSRVRGKRSNPDYEQITAYIRKDTHHAVKLALLQQGDSEFSELVEELLTKWLELQK